MIGWAKNFATVDRFDARRTRTKGKKDPPAKLVKEDVWDVDVPFPLPAVGAKVKVTGKYGYTFTKAQTGIVSRSETTASSTFVQGRSKDRSRAAARRVRAEVSVSSGRG